MQYTNVLVSTFAPFPTLSLSLPAETPVSSLPEIISKRILLSTDDQGLVLSLPNRSLSLTSDPISSLLNNEDDAFVSLRLGPLVLGGKGGFGSQLRAAGGRMSSQKTSNNDSCRDLNGRRLSTVKEAKKLAQYLEDEPVRKKAAHEATKAKLEALERQLGISKDPSSEAGPSDPTGSASADKGKAPELVAGKKHRFDDTAYLEESEAIVDKTKNAVTAALLKKRKKQKTEAAAAAAYVPATVTPAASSAVSA